MYNDKDYNGSHQEPELGATPETSEDRVRGFTVEPIPPYTHSEAAPPTAAPIPPAPDSHGRKPSFVKLAGLCMAFLVLGVAGTSLYFVQGSDSPPPEDAAEVDGLPDEDEQGGAQETLGIQQTANDGSVLTASQVYEQACQQVVGVTTSSAYGTSSGTGYIITADGYIVTNYHVVSYGLNGGEIQVVLHDGQTYPATYIGGESENDVAVLKIEAEGLTPVTLGNSDDTRVGEPIYVVGNPMGYLDYTMTGGLVSALNRDIELEQDNGTYATVNMFQIDAAVNSGNSGGPVYNDRGEVIGMVTAKSGVTSAEGLGFAIPINDVVDLLDDLTTYGYVRGKAYMGIGAQDMSAEVVEAYNLPQGAYVGTVVENGPADKAGIAAKDIITRLGDADITSYSELKKALKNYKAGETASLTVYRAGEYLELQITFDENTTSQDTQQEQSDSQGGMQDGYGNDDRQTLPDDNFPFYDFFGR